MTQVHPAESLTNTKMPCRQKSKNESFAQECSTRWRLTTGLTRSRLDSTIMPIYLVGGGVAAARRWGSMPLKRLTLTWHRVLILATWKMKNIPNGYERECTG